MALQTRSRLTRLQMEVLAALSGLVLLLWGLNFFYGYRCTPSGEQITACSGIQLTVPVIIIASVTGATALAFAAVSSRSRVP